MKKIFLFVTMCILGTGSVVAQITISAGSRINVSGKMAVNGSVNNASALAGLTNAHVVLLGTNQTFTTTSPLSVETLTVNGGGTKTLQGNWEVTSQLQLIDGIIITNSNSRLTYLGTTPPEGNASSYVNGLFFYRGSGRLFYPIGTNTTYAPAIITSAPAGEYGMRAVAADPAFALPEGISSYFPGHYWEMNEVPGSTVSLSLNGLGAYLNEGVPVVLESSVPGGLSSSLSGNVSDGFVTSSQSVSQPVLGIAKTAEFNLIIHDLITPFTKDDVNDKLTIRNIDLTIDNKVTLLDRWGAVVAEWQNYSVDTAFDFEKLSPGNYICVVEYTSPGSKTRSVAKGMVTILKSN